MTRPLRHVNPIIPVIDGSSSHTALSERQDTVGRTARKMIKFFFFGVIAVIVLATAQHFFL
jgi:hypothetical protein